MGNLKIGLSKMDKEFALQGMEQAMDALGDVIIITRRRHCKRGDLRHIYPVMTKIISLLLRIQQIDCGPDDKP